MQLTDNFNIHEFACKDGTEVPWNLMDNVKRLAKNLQVLRDFLGEPVRLNSGYRNPTYNAKVGGVGDSRHIKADAADITVKSKTPKVLHEIIEQLIENGEMEEGGLGLYPGFVHYDTRGYKARW